ncbi:MAG TPA: hypothetical protein VIZ68_00130 [Thermoplasmata archaeon]
MSSGPIRRSIGLPELDPDERKEAIRAPGRGWKEWFYFDFLRVWICLGLFIVDTLFVVEWLQPLNPIGIVATLVPLTYADFLVYQYLWHRPDPEKEDRARQFEPTWYRPVRFGRWTPETWRIREGNDPFGGASVGPDPREFL